MENFFSKIESKNEIIGVIFDCDGVLVDSEKLSCYALNLVFEKYFNVDIGSDYSNVLGKNLNDSFIYYFNKFNIRLPPPVTFENLYFEKDNEYQNLARDILRPFPGVVELLDFLKKKKIEVCVASSGTLEKIEFNLNQTKLRKYFNIITSSDEVTKGKPDPELFLLSAKKMQIDPNRCLVIEDSLSGIEAAKKANMTVVGVSNTFKTDELLQSGADKVVKRIDELIAN
jgi:phosphoglycolate phosphatase